MSFAPVVPLAGFAGWRFLERTLERQEESFAKSPAGLRDEAYFREKIGGIKTAADMVADRKLLRVALSAFGLSADLPNRAFIERVLDSDTTDRASFVNRLADKRYLELAKAFDFRGLGGPLTQNSSVINGVLQRSREMRFEEAVGAQDEQMRLALSMQRELNRIARQNSSEDTKWFTVLGTPSLRAVFETAFTLPKEFAGIDLDRQVAILKSRTERLTGESGISQFTDPARMDQLIRRFFVGSELAQVQATIPGNTALTLLQAMPQIPRRPLRP
jgi:hypothetical protein